MINLPTIDYNGGTRVNKITPLVVEEITKVRYWRNLFFKTQKISLRINEPIKFQDGKEEIIFPENIVIYDLDGDFLEAKIGDVLTAKIGYADKEQQNYKKVNAFSFSILKQGEEIQFAY